MNVSALRISSELTPAWEACCAAQNSLFHSSAWLSVLQRGFKCHPLYVWEDHGDTAFSISVFKAGPFRVGYLGFPVGGPLIGQLTSEHLEALCRLRLPLDLLRLPVSGFGTELETGLGFVTAPETQILNLQGWCSGQMAKLRRDLNKARRAGFALADIVHLTDADEMYRQYCGVVESHSGIPRYPLDYFRNLVRAAQTGTVLRCIGAYDANTLAGFAVVAVDQRHGYYLHGAATVGAKRSGVSDLLVHASIEWAQQHGMEHFSLMSSPASQPGLIRYKEKFGATTRTHRTYELPINPFRTRLYKGALRAHDWYRHLCTPGLLRHLRLLPVQPFQAPPEYAVGQKPQYE